MESRARMVLVVGFARVASSAIGPLCVRVRCVRCEVTSMGDTVTFTITVGNDGEADTAGMRVQDRVPDRIDPASLAWQCTAAVGTTCATPDQGAGALDVTIAWVPKDAALTFTLAGEVGSAADPANDYDEFFNTATVTLSAGSGLTDPTGNNSSTIDLRIDDTLFQDGFELIDP